jgi:transcriptional regulator with XRE-family HTH domain
MDADPVVAVIAERVAFYRRERDLSLDEVAERAGMSKSHVWEIEKGRQRNPTVRAVRDLARAFGVSMSAILGENLRDNTLSPAALKVASMFDAELRASTPTPGATP